MLPLLADKCVNGRIVHGLRLRVPEADLVTADEAGLATTPDPDLLEWAAAQGRVVITQDVNTLVGFANARITAGEPMPGVIVCGRKVTIGEAVDSLELACYGTPDEFKNQVRYCPL
jgi:hypothetical protein